VALITLATAGLWATESSAVFCPYDSASHTLSVSPTSVDNGLTFRANGSYLDVSDVSCALLSDVDTVKVDVSSRPNISITLDQRNGPLGPGHVIETDGANDIEFNIAGMTSASSVQVYGTTGNDVMRVGQYFNKLSGTLTGQINMNAAQETTADVDVAFSGFPGSIQLLGLEGNDTLTGNGVGTISSGASSVKLMLSGGTGSNVLSGSSGDDTLLFNEEPVNEGADVMTGGAGTDTVYAVTSGTPTTGSLSANGVADDGSHCPGAGCNGDNIGQDIENLFGSGSSETILGDSRPQVLSGGGGLDVLKGGGGADQLSCLSNSSINGGAGKDVVHVFPQCADIRGGKGTDTADFGPISPYGAVSVSLDNVRNDGSGGWTGNVHADVEHVIGTTNGDLLIGNDKANILDGFAGDDQIYGQGGADTLMPHLGNDTVSGGSGTDRLSYETLGTAVLINATQKTETGQGNDLFGGIETFVGSSGNDGIFGGKPGERIVGGLGNDSLQGGGGADTLIGGDGDDNLDGGDGTDICDQGLGTGTVLNCEA
jgi:Ca2+-binding RTX toxin-like protein